jgi:transcriptional regulator with XRE-family HTH domain
MSVPSSDYQALALSLGQFYVFQADWLARPRRLKFGWSNDAFGRKHSYDTLHPDGRHLLVVPALCGWEGVLTAWATAVPGCTTTAAKEVYDVPSARASIQRVRDLLSQHREAADPSAEPALHQRAARAVRHERHARGWTQEETARRGGLSKQSLVDIERGAISRLSATSLCRLAVAFDRPPSELIAFILYGSWPEEAAVVRSALVSDRPRQLALEFR